MYLIRHLLSEQCTKSYSKWSPFPFTQALKPFGHLSIAACTVYIGFVKTFQISVGYLKGHFLQLWTQIVVQWIPTWTSRSSSAATMKLGILLLSHCWVVLALYAEAISRCKSTRVFLLVHFGLNFDHFFTEVKRCNALTGDSKPLHQVAGNHVESLEHHFFRLWNFA